MARSFEKLQRSLIIESTKRKAPSFDIRLEDARSVLLDFAGRVVRR